jgi:hypothetical protein
VDESKAPPRHHHAQIAKAPTRFIGRVLDVRDDRSSVRTIERMLKSAQRVEGERGAGR